MVNAKSMVYWIFACLSFYIPDCFGTLGPVPGFLFLVSNFLKLQQVYGLSFFSLF